jgi:hypothetical protein
MFGRRPVRMEKMMVKMLKSRIWHKVLKEL